MLKIVGELLGSKIYQNDRPMGGIYGKLGNISIEGKDYLIAYGWEKLLKPTVLGEHAEICFLSGLADDKDSDCNLVDMADSDDFVHSDGCDALIDLEKLYDLEDFVHSDGWDALIDLEELYDLEDLYDLFRPLNAVRAERLPDQKHLTGIQYAGTTYKIVRAKWSKRKALVQKSGETIGLIKRKGLLFGTIYCDLSEDIPLPVRVFMCLTHFSW